MAGEVEQLKTILTDDLQRYSEDEDRLNYAVSVAIAMINERRGYDKEEYEPKYRTNVLNGAIWWLGKQGAEGYSSTSENSVSVSWQEVPDWLRSVTPRLGGIAR